jgi:hypothetical protein
MNQERINLLPDPHLLALKPQLAHRIEMAAKAITPANFNSFYDAAMRRVFTNVLNHCGASEGSIWHLDETGENLVNVFNNGPDAAALIGFRHSLKSGILSMVLATHKPFMENQVFKDPMQGKTMDNLLRKRTDSLIAVPLYFAKDCRGVITAVKLVPSTATTADSAGFTTEHFAQMQFASELLSRLIDFKLLSLMTGMEKD